MILKAETDRNWSAIRTRSRHEKALRQKLDDMGISVYVPTIQIKTRHRGKKRFVEKVLFPGYVFAALSVYEQETVYETRHAAQILVENDDSTLLRDLNNIKNMLENRKDHMVENVTRVRKGAHVRVKDGPLQGVEGQVTHYKGKHMIVLSVDMLGLSTAVEVDESAVTGIL